MKKLMLKLLLIFLFTGNVFAQPKGQAKEKIEAQKIAYITNRLELMPKEAQVFWPIYNEFQNDKEVINKKYKNKKRLLKMTDEELEEHMIRRFEREQEILDRKKVFFEKMKEVIPIRKIAMLQVAEKEFRTSILEEWKKNRQKRRKQRQGQ